MTEKEKQFVPYEQAVKLRELGFDEGCLTFYTLEGLLDNSLGWFKNEDLFNTEALAPLWQQAFDWIRKEYNIAFWISPCGGWLKKAYLWEYCIATHDNRFIGHRSEYHEEQEALLRRLIRIIEEEECDK